MSTADATRIGKLLGDHTDMSAVHKYVSDNGSTVNQEYETIHVGDSRETGMPVVVSTALTAAEREMVSEAVTAIKPQPKCCFANALRLWEYDPAFSYVEGFAIATGHDILYDHAWNSLNGKLIDVTVGAAPFSEYFGIEFETSELLTHYYEFGEDTDVWGILRNHGDKYQYLREEGYLEG